MATAVMLRVTTHRGSVPGMPWFGSRIHTLTTLGDTTARIAEGYLLESVGDLVNADKIRNVVVRAEVDGTVLKWEMSWEDQADRRQVLELELRQPETVTLSLHDTQGRVRSVVYDGVRLKAGVHARTVDIAQWQPGIYAACLEINGIVQVLPMVVVK